jgi:hypothetical protein
MERDKIERFAKTFLFQEILKALGEGNDNRVNISGDIYQQKNLPK